MEDGADWKTSVVLPEQGPWNWVLKKIVRPRRIEIKIRDRSWTYKDSNFRKYKSKLLMPLLKPNINNHPVKDDYPPEALPSHRTYTGNINKYVDDC